MNSTCVETNVWQSVRLLFLLFSSVCLSTCFQPIFLKLGCITNFDVLVRVELISFAAEIKCYAIFWWKCVSIQLCNKPLKAYPFLVTTIFRKQMPCSRTAAFLSWCPPLQQVLCLRTSDSKAVESFFSSQIWQLQGHMSHERTPPRTLLPGQLSMGVVLYPRLYMPLN